MNYGNELVSWSSTKDRFEPIRPAVTQLQQSLHPNIIDKSYTCRAFRIKELRQFANAYPAHGHARI